MEQLITYFGQQAKVKCDGKCNKAWGILNRPKLYLSDEETEPDDVVFLSDDELGTAPEDPGNYEGGDAKPLSSDEFPNKWCVRACERCEMSKPGEYKSDLKLTDWSKRVYNQPWKHETV